MRVKRFLAMAVSFVPLSACIAHAQTEEAPKRFEVASIHPDDNTAPGSFYIGFKKGGRFVATAVSAKRLIREAFDLPSFQVEGPDWMDSVQFDVTAKTANSEELTDEKLRPLLLALLQERFGLSYHKELRNNIQGYALTQSKGGPKFGANVSDPDSLGPSITGSNSSGHAQLKALRVNMAELSREFSRQLGVVVADETRVQGIFDVSLEWSFYPGPDASYPSIFTALQGQLGLQLVPRRMSAEVVIVDHMERRPGEN